MAGIHTTKIFAALAKRSGLSHANGDPALNKTYTDDDLLLVRNAILAACDSLDGLADGIVDNFPACTTPLVHAKLTAIQCAGPKTPACLTADQIGALERGYEGPKDSRGKSLYPSFPWDAGVGGLAGNSYNPNWRSWWIGSYGAATNNAIKLNFVSAVAVAYSSPPWLPFTTADSLKFSLNYDFDVDPARIHSSAGIYTPASSSMLYTDSTDLSAFGNRGGKLIVYHGVSDSSVSINDTIAWYDAMNAAQGGNARTFARLFAIPGMNHCSGGPATETFDALSALVDWVEKGVAPERIVATASTPAYFGVASRSRPLCPYPEQARYRGTGDINDAVNFSCQVPQ
jgi:feruloyl esterase